jgi:tRNA(Ile)-lysidine synthase TilS/MesJ
MHPKNGAVVRPLLACRREGACASGLRARALRFVEDESNADVAIPRNRVRAELVPLLEQRFNPAIVDVLADEAIARASLAWMRRWPTDRGTLVRPIAAEDTSVCESTSATWRRCRWRCAGPCCGAR